MTDHPTPTSTLAETLLEVAEYVEAITLPNGQTALAVPVRLMRAAASELRRLAALETAARQVHAALSPPNCEFVPIASGTGEPIFFIREGWMVRDAADALRAALATAAQPAAEGR